MEEKDTIDKNREEGAKRLRDEYIEQASYLGTILPLLDIFYVTVLEKQIKKYDLNIVKEFWIYFGLLVFAIIFYFDPFKVETIIFLFFATIITLILYNQIFFKKRIIPDENTEIETFLIDIENKSFPEVTEFIKQYRKKLKDQNFEKIVSSKFGNNPVIYNLILNFQILSSNLLVYIVKSKKIDVMGDGLFLDALKRFDIGMNFENYEFLVSHFKDNDKIIKILNLYNPNYSKKKTFVNSLTRLNQKFLISLRTGKIFENIRFLSLLLVSIVAIIGYNQISNPTINLEPYVSFPILFFINYIFAILITTGIVIVVISSFFELLIKIFWMILSFFTPSTSQG